MAFTSMYPRSTRIQGVLPMPFTHKLMRAWRKPGWKYPMDFSAFLPRTVTSRETMRGYVDIAPVKLVVFLETRRSRIQAVPSLEAAALAANYSTDQG